jgi:hypothetical protein
MDFPVRPTDNFYQLLGAGLSQGAGLVGAYGTALDEEEKRKNVLQDMVERRAAAILEAKKNAWEFEQKQQDKADEDAARAAIAEGSKNGISMPDASTIIPAVTKDVPGPWSPKVLPPVNSNVQPAGLPSLPVEVAPARTVSTPQPNRPMTPQDARDIAYKYGQLSAKDYTAMTPFDEAKAKAAGTIAGYTATNHSDFMKAAADYVTNKLASDPTRPPSMAEVDAAAAVADPTGSRYSDKAYAAYIKSFDKGAAAQNSETGVKRIPIAQQNADANTKRAAAEAAKAATSTTLIPGSSLTPKQGKQRTDWGMKLQKAYETAVTSSRGGTNLQNASQAYETINKALDANENSPLDVTGIKDQVSKLLNPGYAVSKVQFEHLNAGGLLDKVANWTQGLGHSTTSLTAAQKQQYQTLVDRLGQELRDAHAAIKKDYWTQAHKISTQNGYAGEDSISLTPKEFTFEADAQPPADPTQVFGPTVGAASAQGPKIGDTKLNSHGVKVVFGPSGWGLAQ